MLPDTEDNRSKLIEKMKLLASIILLALCGISCIEGMETEFVITELNLVLVTHNLFLGKSVGDMDVSAIKADPIEFTHFNLWTR